MPSVPRPQSDTNYKTHYVLVNIQGLYFEKIPSNSTLLEYLEIPHGVLSAVYKDIFLPINHIEVQMPHVRNPTLINAIIIVNITFRKVLS